jgi:Zn-dependent peptidase ImmA (M78 family)
MNNTQIIVSFMPTPQYIRGFCQAKSDKSVIVINSLMEENIQKQALVHELAHIILSHFKSDKDVATMENEADDFCANICYADI